jgi:hypothetical protein
MKMSLTKANVLACILGLIILSGTHSDATPVTITNGSFESDTAGTTPPTGWSGGLVTASSSSLSTGVGTGASGNNFLTLTGGTGATSALQTTNLQATPSLAGDILTLTVAIGDPSANDLTAASYVGDVNLVLSAGVNTVVASNTVADTPALTPGGFSLLTLTYQLQSSNFGNFGIEFLAPGSGTGDLSRQFDNVTLSLNLPSAPEPSIWAMLAGGLVLLAWTCRRSQVC